MNDDYDNAKADKAILEKLTIDRDGECDYPECDDVPERESGFCAFHTLLRRQALGEDIPERALEIAFENPNDITSDAALKKARTEPKKARPQIVPGGGFQMSDEANYRAEGTAECGCTFRQNRKDYETEVEYCKLHGAAPRLLEQLVKTANHVHAAYCIRNKAGCVAACENARTLITEIEL